MIANQLHISDFDFISITDLEIDRKIGEHATATIRGYICDEQTEEYKIQVLEKRWITVTAEDENGDNRIIMAGIVAGFCFAPHPHAMMLTLVLKSGTYLMDTVYHFRSFQNTGKTYMDVLDIINQPYKETGVIGEDCLKTAHADFLLQYKETDWEFVKRLSSHFGLMVTPAIERQGVYYYIGNRNSSAYSLPPFANISISKSVDTFMIHRSNGFGSPIESDYLECKIKTREIYNLWDVVMCENEGGCVSRIISRYEQGELFHTYTLQPVNGLKRMRIHNAALAGCSFQATVNKVMQDMVQVKILGDENSSQEITRWFPFSTGYSSPDGAGWYCMPEVNDTVRLQITDQMEEHAYVISAVHKETGSDRKDPDCKSFKTKFGKELRFTPNSLEMTNHQGMSIKITDEEGIQITSSKNVSIVSAGDMTLSSEKSSLMIAGSESVDIRQGRAGLHLDKDVTFTGGKFRIQ